jgi:hypothetical protein
MTARVDAEILGGIGGMNNMVIRWCSIVLA